MPLRTAVIAGLIALAAILPAVVERTDVLNLLFILYLHVALGQSWNILGGLAGQHSLGHAAFFGLGALATRSLWLGGVPFGVAYAAGGLAAVAFAFVIGAPTFRLRGAYFSIGTLGMAEALRITVSQNLPHITSLPVEQIAGYDLAARCYVALGLALATCLTTYVLLRSPFGLGLQAVREDEGAAQATGVPVLRHKLGALLLSSLFAGLAGSTFAFQQISYYPGAAFSPIWTFDALLIAFVGGLGTLPGPIIGAIFFVLVRERLAVTLVQVHQVIFGILFILIVLVYPGGLVEAWARFIRRWKNPTAKTPSARSSAPENLRDPRV